jgi:glycosyltransferase involved in cell wall biosynthesis
MSSVSVSVGADVLLVLPAFNEQAALPGVIEQIRAVLPAAGILVVDDGSSDGTADVASATGVRVLRLPFNLGVGGALRAGLLVGLREGWSVVVQCDADGQHPPASVPDLLAGLADADIVIGARFAGSGDYQVRGARSWAMVLLAHVMSRVHRTRLTDVTSGFRAFGQRAIEVLGRELPPDYLGDTVEALVIAKEYGLRVAQVPVAMLPRQGGVASHRAFRATLYLLRVMLILVLSLLRLLGARIRRRRR